MEGIVNFNERDEHGRSINLIIAENGGGKTELLFAFSWALYNFDFSTLQNKEDTPYSLNSEIYRELKNSSNDCSDECWVKVVFSNKGETYTLKKKECFEKLRGYSSPKSRTEIELVVKLKSGATKPPLKDQNFIERLLNEVIPLKVLNGIIFDGERMQKLTSTNERSVEGVKGVIFDVTNQERLEYFLDIIKSVESNLNGRMSKIKRTADSRTIETISNKIENLENKITKNTDDLETVNSELIVCDSNLEDIRARLLKYTEIDAIEKKLIQNEKDLSKANKNLEKAVDDFGAEFNNSCFTLIFDEILNDAREMIESFNVPKGLNVQAVESILEKGECICGERLSNEKSAILKSLLNLLPPDNLNSALLEIIDGLKSNQEKSLKKISEYRSNIKQLDSQVEQYTKDANHYRSQILNSDIGDSKELEEMRINLLSQKAELNQQKKNLPGEIEADKIEAKYLREKKASLLEMAELNDNLFEKWKFIDKSKKATEQIRDDLQHVALSKINELLKKSYAELTERAENGRDVHLIHNINVPGIKYRVVNYYGSSVPSYIQNANWENLCKKYGLDYSNLSDSQKLELAILENAVGKSTGQSKIVAIPFAKAILDYSCSTKEDEIQDEKFYPFLIDSPFGDLSGVNLKNSAKNLHSFSNQVILMLSHDSYNVVKGHIEPYVQSTTKLSKVPSKNQSIIEVDP
jgi:DNA sulfur modification protein DndD